MKSAGLVFFVFLITSTILRAQNGSLGVAGMEGLSPSQANTPPSTLQWSIPVMPMGCPVSLRAQHGAWGGMLQTDKNPPQGVGQLLHLTLSNPSGQQIVSARVRVHGLSGASRSIQTLSGSLKPNSTRTLVVQFFPDTAQSVVGNLRVPAMTAVLTIDLLSVTFADGSTQTFTERDGCHIAPDMKMLIAGQ